MMKKKACRYIIALLFSLLTIFAGAGVAVIHCYCVGCRVVHECCDAHHNHEHNSVAVHSDLSNQGECCTSTVLKVDVLKGADELPSLQPFEAELCLALARLFNPLLSQIDPVYNPNTSPPPPDARTRRALYKVYVI